MPVYPAGKLHELPERERGSALFTASPVLWSEIAPNEPWFSVVSSLVAASMLSMLTSRLSISPYTGQSGAISL